MNRTIKRLQSFLDAVLTKRVSTTLESVIRIMIQQLITVLNTINDALRLFIDEQSTFTMNPDSVLTHAFERVVVYIRDKSELLINENKSANSREYARLLIKEEEKYEVSEETIAPKIPPLLEILHKNIDIELNSISYTRRSEVLEPLFHSRMTAFNSALAAAAGAGPQQTSTLITVAAVRSQELKAELAAFRERIVTFEAADVRRKELLKQLS